MGSVTFLPDNITVEVPEGSALLDAARTAGVHAETPCGGSGLCKKCAVRIAAGEADFGNDGYLPGEMAAEGYVLLCKAKVKSGPLSVMLPSKDDEKGKFSSDNDLALVDGALLPKALSPVVKSISLNVQAPAAGDGLSDADRFDLAVKERLGTAASMPLGALQALPETLRAQDGEVAGHYYKTQQGAAIVDITPAGASGDYGVAVDIGTTTVAVQLVDMGSGRVLGTKTEYNAQVACGLDVISRINYAKKPERLAELRQKALSTINGNLGILANGLGIDARNIRNISVAGNTTMIHLLLGVAPEYIRLEPYTPAIYAPQMYAAGEIGIGVNPQAPVYIAPGVGSYVGGDITSGVLCTTLAGDSSDICLFIDIGTNGEIVLGNSDFLIGCACSAGPAFEGGGIEKGMRASEGAIERAVIDKVSGLCDFATIGGAQPAGICGSGMISLAAGLFKTGWLDPSGRFERVRHCDAISIESRNARYIVDHPERGGRGEVYITEADIDNLIRAKAAIFSACRVLLKNVGLEFGDISRMYIAGGFGRYLNIENAKAIGLVPEIPEDRFVFLGNASLSGAYMTLLSEQHRAKQREIAKKITYIDLSLEPGYMNEYTAALFLPHTDETLFAK